MGFHLQIVVCVVLGMLAIPLGIFPSIFLFRDLANGTDGSDRSKRIYAFVLWGGMALAWLLGAAIAWNLIEALI